MFYCIFFKCLPDFLALEYKPLYIILRTVNMMDSTFLSKSCDKVQVILKDRDYPGGHDLITSPLKAGFSLNGHRKGHQRSEAWWGLVYHCWLRRQRLPHGKKHRQFLDAENGPPAESQHGKKASDPPTPRS